MACERALCSVLEVTKTLWVWAGKTVALGVHPGNDGDQVCQVRGENTGEQNLVTTNNIHFEHVSIKLLLNNWNIFNIFDEILHYKHSQAFSW